MKKLRQTYGFEKPIDDAYPLPIIPNPPRNPTVNDTDYVQGQIWINPTTNDIWLLSSFTAGNAIWVLIGTALPQIDTLTGDVGGAVGPDAAYNINLLGANGNATSGNPATNTITISQLGAFIQQHIFYVGKHGNDAQPGTNINTAVLTFGQALVLATAAVPGAANRYAIVCLDDGIYTENIVCVQYVDIYAPNAALTGTITAVDDSSVKFRTQNVAAGTIGVLKAAGVGYSDIDIDQVNVTGNGVGFVCTSGLMNCIWKRMYIDTGFGIGDLTSAIDHMHLKGGDIYVSGTGIAIARANAGITVGHVDHILQIGVAAGTAVACFVGTIDLFVNKIHALLNGIVVTGGICNLTINELLTTAAYNVANGATLKMIVENLTGTETYGATANVAVQYLDPAGLSGFQFVGEHLALSKTEVAGEIRLAVGNNDNTNAASFAQLEVSVGGGVAGDPCLSVNVIGGTSWKFGIDNNVDDNLYIGPGPAGALATPAQTITSAAAAAGYGHVTFPLTAAFSSYLSATVAAVTGDGTAYTIICDTELFDQNADYNNGTGVFTAPVTGRYAFHCTIGFIGLLVANTDFDVRLVTTANSFLLGSGNPGTMMETFSGGNNLVLTYSAFVPMTAGDTAHLSVDVQANAAKNVGIMGQIAGAGPFVTTFSGFLQC